jgi:hypothetical protein
MAPAVRPDDLLTALRQVARPGSLDGLGAPLLTRMEQGPLDPATGEIGDPLSG